MARMEESSAGFRSFVTQKFATPNICCKVVTFSVGYEGLLSTAGPSNYAPGCILNGLQTFKQLQVIDSFLFPTCL